MNRLAHSLMLIGVALTTPLWAGSLPVAGPAQALPDGTVTPAPLLASNPAGTASLVPLMATEMEANHLAAVDSSATGTSGTVGKPIDDIAFVKLATENGRKEINSAREALPQLKQPELKRIAEMLVVDRSGANARLSSIAEAKNWPMPGPQRLAPPPSGTASSDFDAKWTAEMIARHELSAALYRAQAQSGEDQDVRKYASEMLPTIERHLAELRNLQK